MMSYYLVDPFVLSERDTTKNPKREIGQLLKAEKIQWKRNIDNTSI
jgi:hypothetical protein